MLVAKSKTLVMTNFICWKYFPKALLSQKNRRSYLKILLVNYVHKLHLINLCSLCISVSLPGEKGENILRGELSTILDFFFPFVCLVQKHFQKSVFTNADSYLSYTNWRLHSKCSWNIAILLQFIFCEKNEQICSLFVPDVIYFLWLLSESIECRIFCHSFWSWES